MNDPRAPQSGAPSRVVLITGGTRGIGLATARAFARRGDAVTVTHKWGSVPEAELAALFRGEGLPPPHLADADAANEADARAVLGDLHARHGRLDVLVSNVAFAPVVRSLDDYTKRGLHAAIEYSTWPLVMYVKLAREIFGRAPQHVIAVSSEGAGAYHVQYDFVAAAKAALEALVRYMNRRLMSEGTRVNAVRTRFVHTQSLRDTFGPAFEGFVEATSPGLFTEPDEVAAAIVGITSDRMRAMAGQTLVVDRGASVFDTFGRVHEARRAAAEGREEER